MGRCGGRNKGIRTSAYVTKWRLLGCRCTEASSTLQGEATKCTHRVQYTVHPSSRVVWRASQWPHNVIRTVCAFIRQLVHEPSLWLSYMYTVSTGTRARNDTLTQTRLSSHLLGILPLPLSSPVVSCRVGIATSFQSRKPSTHRHCFR